MKGNGRSTTVATLEQAQRPTNLNEMDLERKYVHAALEKIKGLLAQRTIEAEAAKDCSTRFEYLTRAVEEGELQVIIDQADQFVLAIRRHMGQGLPSEIAYDLADWTLMDIKRPIGDPGQIYREAMPFVLQLIDIARDELQEDLFLSKRNRPMLPATDDPVGIVADKIRSLELPEEAATLLLKTTDTLAALAPRLDYKSGIGPIETDYNRAVHDLRRELTIYRENDTLTSSLADTTLGMMYFSFPAYLCNNGVSWAVQAAALGYAGYQYFNSPSGHILAAGSVQTFINNNPNATPAQIQAEALAAVMGMNRNQMFDTINILIQMRNNNPHLWNEFQEAIRAIRGALPPC